METVRSLKRIETLRQITSSQQASLKSHPQHNIVQLPDLSKIIIKMKTQRHAAEFAKKMLRNFTGRKPTEYLVKGERQINEERIIKWQGFHINQTFDHLMLVLEIIMSLFLFVITGFQAFLEDFRTGPAATSDFIVTIKIIALIVFSIRFILDLITIYVEHGRRYIFISDILKERILSLYLVYEFISIALVTLTLSFPDSQAQGVIQFVFSITKTYRLAMNLNVIEGYYLNSVKKTQLWSLIAVVMSNIFFAHLIGCILLALYYMDSTPDHSNNWLYLNKISNLPWNERYFYAFYWAVTIMMTVGFGDFTPKTPNQAFIVAFIEMFSVIILVYNIGEIGSILLAIRQSRQKITSEIGLIRRMSLKDNISGDLQQKIQSHLIELDKITKEQEDLQQLQLFNKLPESLRREYENQSNSVIFQHLPYLRTLRPSTMFRLIESFKAETYCSGESILRASNPNLQLKIIKEGEVSFCFFKPFSKMNNTIIERQTVSSKEHLDNLLINLNSLFRMSKINYDINSLSYCFALSLHIEAFCDVLRENIIDFEFYSMERDTHRVLINLYESIQCKYCCKEFHTKFNCPKLHFFPFKSLVFFKSCSINKLQPRSFLLRNKRIKKTHCYFRRKVFHEVEKLQKAKISKNERNEEALRYKTDIKRQRFEAAVESQLNFEIEFENGHNFIYYFPALNIERIQDIALNQT